MRSSKLLLLMLLLVGIFINQVAGMEAEDEDNEDNEFDDMDFEREGQVVDTTVKIALIEADIQEASSKRASIEKRIHGLEAEAKRSSNPEIQQALEAAKNQHSEYSREISTLQSSIKPLYGVISYQHLQEHRIAIYESFGSTIEVGKNHVFYEMLFAREDTSIQSLLSAFVAGVFFGYIIGLIGFVFTAPFTIYQYCDSWMDIPAAVFMWVVGLIMFLLPGIAIAYGTVVAVRLQAKRMREERMAEQRAIENQMRGYGQ
eukprot:TRINITY_DN3438_c1_g2_i1.p1 TRINITY_DN3438_c1_g2~~TRINITY_DN3438_c1_g2_i1.p1  ORF type:complete len:283 (+),score=73.30 TRINITY_DN3438_c1_g2_i1:75-851(+)